MIELFVGAVVYSNLLALLAVGLSIALLTCRVSNFSQGDLAMVGVYAAYTASLLLGVSPYACLPIAGLAGGAVSLISYILVFEPLRERASLVTLMVASMALDMVIRYSLHVYADILQATFGVYTRPFMFSDFTVRIAGRPVAGVFFVSTSVVASSLILFYTLLFKTRLGVAMRAAIENPQLAEVLGINVRRVFAVSWFLSGALTGVAGALLPYRMLVAPDTGWSMLLSIFASVTVGGIGSLGGSIAGAYLIGFAETALSYTLASVGLSTAYRPAISFAAIIITLLASPRGLAGLWSNGWVRWRSSRSH